MAKLGILVNPTSRKGKGKQLGEKLVAGLKAQGHTTVNLSGTDWTSALQNAKAGAMAGLDALVVSGGDGTVHIGVNIAAQTNLPLAIAATGTGNDYAKSLGLPEVDIPATLQMIDEGLKKPPVKIDLGRIYDENHPNMSEWFACNLYMGLVAKVNRRANAIKFPTGSSRYYAALLMELLKFDVVDYKITLDDKQIKMSTALIAIGNVPYLGGGICMFPESSPISGSLDITLVENSSRKQMINMCNYAYKGDIRKFKEVSIYHAKKIKVEALNKKMAKKEVVFSDGEFVGKLPITCEVVPEAISVIGIDKIPFKTEDAKKMARKI